MRNWAGVFVPLSMRQPSPRPATVARASRRARSGGRPWAMPASAQGFDHVEHVGRAGARQPGHGVHLVLVVQAHDLAHGGQEGRRPRSRSSAVACGIADDGGDAGARLRRACWAWRARCGPPGRRLPRNAAMGCQRRRRRRACRDRSCSAGRAVAHHLRLDGDQGDGGACGQGAVQCHAGAAQPVGRGRVDHMHRRQAVSPPASQPASIAPSPSCRSPAAPRRAR